jgi:hypothetical protein
VRDGVVDLTDFVSVLSFFWGGLWLDQSCAPENGGDFVCLGEADSRS